MCGGQPKVARAASDIARAASDSPLGAGGKPWKGEMLIEMAPKGLKVHIQSDVAPGQVGIHGLEVLDEISALLKRVGSQILPRGSTVGPAFNRL